MAIVLASGVCFILSTSLNSPVILGPGKSGIGKFREFSAGHMQTSRGPLWASVGSTLGRIYTANRSLSTASHRHSQAQNRAECAASARATLGIAHGGHARGALARIWAVPWMSKNGHCGMGHYSHARGCTRRRPGTLQGGKFGSRFVFARAFQVTQALRRTLCQMCPDMGHSGGFIGEQLVHLCWQ